ncbi:MAG: tetratricopeptide repeat protein [Amylibacter sp.]
MDKIAPQSKQLSSRELEIAEAFSSGENYNQIADRLCIAPSTVRTHLSTVYRKLGVTSKLDLHKYFKNSAQVLESKEHQQTLYPDKPSIAVLAFENMSGDPEQEYFSDGITEDIITALSRSPWLFIIARNTTFTYKGTNVDVKQVAEELGVRYVLEGSVRKSGNRIRVTAQLIDGITGGHVWSERYDGQLKDVFDLQDEITRNVVASVLTRVHLTAGEPAEQRPRPNLTVWELTMRAWHLLYDFTPESFASAETLLQQALKHDPDSSEANLVLSVIHYHSVILGFASDAVKTAALAYELGRRATRLDDRNEYAQWALGLSCFALHRHEEAITALERAVELNPNCSLAYGSLGTALGLVGRVDVAITCQEIAIRSNPRDPSIFFRFSGMALAHYLARRYDTAVEWASKSVHLMPQWYFGHFIHTASHMQAGRLEEAKAAVQSCHEALPDVAISHLDRMPLKCAVEMEQLRDCLRKAGLPE